MCLLCFSEENTLLCTHEVKHMELHRNNEMRTLTSKAVIPVRLYMTLATYITKRHLCINANHFKIIMGARLDISLQVHWIYVQILCWGEGFYCILLQQLHPKHKQ